MQNLVEVQRVLAYAKETPTGGIRLRPVVWSELTYFAFSDASWANAASGRKQAGLLILAASSKALAGEVPASILEWRSHRLRRVTRSTLAAEAAAMDAAVDHAVYMSHFMSCLYKSDHILSGISPPIFKVVPVTDCRSLYDALQRLSASLQEKRVLLDLVAIRETCGGNLEGSSAVRWVPGEHQLADGLTKRDKNLREKLAKICMNPCFSLVAPLPTTTTTTTSSTSSS